MKTKTVLTTLAAIALSAQTAIFTFSNNSLMPNTQECSSDFRAPQNLGPPVNVTGANGNGPFLAPNGLSLYFSSNRPGGQGDGDIWVSQRPSLTSAWGPPINLGARINTESNENQPTLSLDGLTMFFNSSRPGGFGSGDIYMTTRTNPNDDFGWSEPVNLGPIVNTEFGELGPGYFEDQTTGVATLFFQSNRARGLGDFDIYQSTRNADGTFNPTTNVTELNSEAVDGRPQVRRDGLEVVFHSNRPGGLGGLDIWIATRASTSSPWNPPVNLTNVNSVATDFTPSFSPDGSILYFSSNRAGGFGIQDIYTATRACFIRSSTTGN